MITLASITTKSATKKQLEIASQSVSCHSLVWVTYSFEQICKIFKKKLKLTKFKIF
jgi:hypothetical protein